MKNKMEKVLIALDYNPTAQKVAEVGFSMAKAMNAEIILLHAVATPAYYSSTEYFPVTGFGVIDMSTLKLDSIDSVKNASKHFLDKTKEHLGDKSIQTLVEDGDCAESILNAAKKINADIIVMGSHSRRWLENILMGSITEKVLHHTTIPLFIVPTKKHD